MGETEDEVYTAMRDLKEVGCDILTIGQYLQPSTSWHLPVDRWVHPDEFARFKEFGENELGFAWVESGPLVRSSYHAGKQYRSAADRLATTCSRFRAERCGPARSVGRCVALVLGLCA